MIELVVMTELRGGTQLSQSGVGSGVSVKFRSFMMDVALPFMVILAGYIW